MTSLPLFHLGMVVRIGNFDQGCGAELLRESVGRVLPRGAGAECHVDLTTEPALSSFGGVVDVITIRSADGEHVDVVRRRSRLTVVASSPRPVDEQPLDPTNRAEFLTDHQRRTERHQNELRKGSNVRIALVRHEHLRAADGRHRDQRSVGQSADLGGDRLVRLAGPLR